jgi:hypothetical protein
LRLIRYKFQKKKLPMNDKSTQKILKPRREILQNILMFAAVYQVERLSNGEIIQYFLN